MSGPPGAVPVEERENRLLLQGAGWEMCSLLGAAGAPGGDRRAATRLCSLLGLADPVCVCVGGVRIGCRAVLLMFGWIKEGIAKMVYSPPVFWHMRNRLFIVRACRWVWV